MSDQVWGGRWGRSGFVWGVACFAMLTQAPGAAVAQLTGFGAAVAAGDAAVFVGESLDDTAPGAVHVFRTGSAGWEAAQKLTASNAEPGDHFGRALALADGALLVGATVASVGNIRPGALYVFEPGPDGNWVEIAMLPPSDATEEGSFGRVSATDGRTVLMADWAADQGRGGVYVFERVDGSWRETAKLVASDAAPNDWFGMGLAVSGDRILVGTPRKNQGRGAVYSFRRDGTGGWVEDGVLTVDGAQPNAQFGSSLALLGEAAIVGAPGSNQFSGVVYAFVPTPGGWAPSGQVTAFDGGPGAQFGFGVARVDDELWVSAPGAVGEGRIYKLTMRDGELTGMTKIVSRDLEPGDAFGAAFDATDRLAVVGVTGDDYGLGSAVVFERSDGEVVEVDRLLTEVATLEAITGGQVDCTDGEVSMFPCEDVDLVSFLPVKDIGGTRGVQLNDVWGWTDPQTSREYALVGRYDGTSFVDITDAANPRYLGNLAMTAGATGNVWRDIKVYENHAYVVADGAGAHGMQVFDLTRLRDVTVAPIEFEADAHYDGIASAHNVVINESTGFAYAVGVNGGGETCGGGLHMIDLRDPKSPTFAGCFQDPTTGEQRTGYSHDAQCVTYHGPDTEHQGKEICLGSNETALSIADVSNKDATVPLAAAEYPNVAYAHQGWLDEQHEYFYMNDEGDESGGLVPNTRTLVWDVKDLDDPVLVKEYLGPSESIDHNLYVKGDFVYESNYVSGLRILDISDRENPREVAFFDTVPASDAQTFDGSWSNYPYFQSGVIVVTSGREGLFLLKKRDRPVS